eukprot:UN20691
MGFISFIRIFSQKSTLCQQMKPIISKVYSAGVFLIFSLLFFVAFNSRDMTMLWVLNLCSRSSPTKLWKRIFDLKLKKFSDA